MFTVSMWNSFLSDCLLAVSLHSNKGQTGTEKDVMYGDNVMYGEKVTSPKMTHGSLSFLPHSFISEWSQLYNSAFKSVSVFFLRGTC